MFVNTARVQVLTRFSLVLLFGVIWQILAGWNWIDFAGREMVALLVVAISYPVETGVLRLRCILMRGGHNYGRWWWPDRAEAHCLCDECADMRTPKNRHFWMHRERIVNVHAPESN